MYRTDKRNYAEPGYVKIICIDGSMIIYDSGFIEYNVTRNNQEYSSVENLIIQTAESCFRQGKSIFDEKFLICKNVLLDYIGNDEVVYIPDNMKEISKYCFKAAENLEKVIFPEGLVKICKEVFAHCGKLKEIYLPDSCAELEEAVFAQCTELKKVRLSPNCKPFKKGYNEWIKGVFYGCSSLEYVECNNLNDLVAEDTFVGTPLENKY